MTDTLIRLEGIDKWYGPAQVLDGVDFSVDKGEIVGLLGDNGAGKSTLVKIMSGVEDYSAGRFFWEGKELSHPTRIETEELGLETIFQDSALVDQLSISRNIFMGREMTNALGMMKLNAMNKVTDDILDTVITIEGIRSPKQQVSTLSGGQKQAVAIARAVHFKRTLLVLDEPTSALAVRATEALLAYLVQLKQEGVSSVLVTHNLHHAYQVCDRHVVLNHGKKILDVKKSDTTLEELTAAVAEGRTGLDRLAKVERTTQTVRRSTRELSSLFEDLTAGGLLPTTRVVRFETATADEELAGKLGVDVGTTVLYMERIRFAGDTPLAVMRNWLTVGWDDLTPAELEKKGLYAALRERGIVPTTGDQVIGGKAASDYEASALMLSAGAPLVTAERVMKDASGVVVELGSHVYDAQQYSVVTAVSSD